MPNVVAIRRSCRKNGPSNLEVDNNEYNVCLAVAVSPSSVFARKYENKGMQCANPPLGTANFNITPIAVYMSTCSDNNLLECFQEKPSWCRNEQVCQGRKGVKRCEWSNGLDTALYNNIPLPFYFLNQQQ